MEAFLLFWRSYFLSPRFFGMLGLLAVGFVFAHFYPILLVPVLLAAGIFVVAVLAESTLLYARDAISFERKMGVRFSNGDENPVYISMENNYSFSVTVELRDEVPDEWAKTDFVQTAKVESGATYEFTYSIYPNKRGAYRFEHVNVLVSGFLGLVQRRFVGAEPQEIAVYPSFIQMRKYELAAIHNRLMDFGLKKIRKAGQHTEFEQIKEYVAGDDIRSINWKASAKRGNLMINRFQEEKSQQIYSIIDKGRMMRSPFNGMSLLDYAINASLVLSNTALHKGDKAGVITVSEDKIQHLPAQRKSGQMNLVLEFLYKQETRFLEPDLEMLYSHIKLKLKQRSLLVLFTNLDSTVSLKRNLPYFKKLAAHHLLLVVFFKNTEMDALIHAPASNTEDIFIKTTAAQMAYEKQLVITELQRAGIAGLLTSPEDLSINTLNKYLEMKSQGLL